MINRQFHEYILPHSPQKVKSRFVTLTFISVKFVCTYRETGKKQRKTEDL